MLMNNQFGFSSVVELMKNKFYERNPKYAAIQNAKTAIDMNYLQMRVREMAQERQGRNDN